MKGIDDADGSPGVAAFCFSNFLALRHGNGAINDEGRTKGEYLLGAVSTLGDNEGTLTVFSASLVNEGVLTYYPSMGNEQLFVNAVTAHMDQSSTFSIPSKSLETIYNTIQNPGLWSTTYLIILPVGILVCGFVFWMKRRKL